MQRPLPLYVGEYYHVYNSGVEKRDIFIQKKDWDRFHRLLYLANSTIPFRFRDLENQPLNNIERGSTLVAIGAYVLMPNHFHILVKEINSNGLSNFMEKLTTGYSMYFNKKYERVGPLFQGRFKAAHIDNDEYLKYLYAYIHLNPIKIIDPDWKEVGIKNERQALQHIENYQHSSYPDYDSAIREVSSILTKNEFPEYFSKSHSFKTYINDCLNWQGWQGRPSVF